MRTAFSRGLVAAAQHDPRILLLTGDHDVRRAVGMDVPAATQTNGLVVGRDRIPADEAERRLLAPGTHRAHEPAYQWSHARHARRGP